MSEKPEPADEFEDEDSEEVAGGDDSLDVDRLMQDLDKRKRGAPKGAEPAWRKLERLLEQKRTSELSLATKSAAGTPLPATSPNTTATRPPGSETKS